MSQETITTGRKATTTNARPTKQGQIMRSAYMNGEASHDEYYSQFVTKLVRDQVIFHIGEKRIKASTDKHMNDIPLHKWDNVFPSGAPRELAAAFRACGDTPSMSGLVCVAKAAARQIKATGI